MVTGYTMTQKERLEYHGYRFIHLIGRLYFVRNYSTGARRFSLYGFAYLTMAYPIETEKIRTHHAKIVVECTTGKPYYSIEWFDPTKNEYYLGYSSYSIDNVTGWLKECFEIVEAPKTNADHFRAMSDDELADLLSGMCKIAAHCYDCPMDGICPGVTYSPAEWIKWLKQPAEVDNG